MVLMEARICLNSRTRGMREYNEGHYSANIAGKTCSATISGFDLSGSYLRNFEMGENENIISGGEWY